jgi:hypothetical protein
MCGIGVLKDPHAQCYMVELPGTDERRAFFGGIIETAKLPPPVKIKKTERAEGRVTRSKRKRNEPSLLPAAGMNRHLSGNELGALEQEEEAILRQLRMYFRSVLNDLIRDKKFKDFREMPSVEDTPDYYEIIDARDAECLANMLGKLNDGVYDSTEKFLSGIEQIRLNAYEYNSNEGVGRKVRSAAADLKDSATHLIEEARHEHAELLKECEVIAESRKRRRLNAVVAAKAASMHADEEDPLLGGGEEATPRITIGHDDEEEDDDNDSDDEEDDDLAASASPRSPRRSSRIAPPVAEAEDNEEDVGVDEEEVMVIEQSDEQAGPAKEKEKGKGKGRGKGKGKGKEPAMHGTTDAMVESEADTEDADAAQLGDEGNAAEEMGEMSDAHATAVEEATETAEFTFDEEKLAAVVEALVVGSEDATVAELDALSSQLRHAIFDHRLAHDNSVLEGVLEAMVAEFVAERAAPEVD